MAGCTRCQASQRSAPRGFRQSCAVQRAGRSFEGASVLMVDRPINAQIRAHATEYMERERGALSGPRVRMGALAFTCHWQTQPGTRPRPPAMPPPSPRTASPSPGTPAALRKAMPRPGPAGGAALCGDGTCHRETMLWELCYGVFSTSTLSRARQGHTTNHPNPTACPKLPQ